MYLKFRLFVWIWYEWNISRPRRLGGSAYALSIHVE